MENTPQKGKKNILISAIGGIFIGYSIIAVLIVAIVVIPGLLFNPDLRAIFFSNNESLVWLAYLINYLILLVSGLGMVLKKKWSFLPLILFIIIDLVLWNLGMQANPKSEVSLEINEPQIFTFQLFEVVVSALVGIYLYFKRAILS